MKRWIVTYVDPTDRVRVLTFDDREEAFVHYKRVVGSPGFSNISFCEELKHRKTSDSLVGSFAHESKK